MNVPISHLAVISGIDAAALISLVSVVVNIIICCISSRQKKKEISMTLLHELVIELNTSPCFNKTFYLFDYGASWYSSAFHRDKELQNDVDATLSFFSCICYLRMTGQLNDAQFSFFSYRICRTLSNEGVQAYLYNLYRFTQRIQAPMPFSQLFEYAEKEGYLPKDFKENSGKFPQCLNI